MWDERRSGAMGNGVTGGSETPAGDGEPEVPTPPPALTPDVRDETLVRLIETMMAPARFEADADPPTAALVGVGRLGSQIAATLALAGVRVRVHDHSEFTRQRAIENIRGSLCVHEADGGLVPGEAEDALRRISVAEASASARARPALAHFAHTPALSPCSLSARRAPLPAAACRSNLAAGEVAAAGGGGGAVGTLALRRRRAAAFCQTFGGGISVG